MNQEPNNELAPEQVDEILSLCEGLIDDSHENIIDLFNLAEQLQYVREHSVYKQPYTVNLFEYYNSTEPVTSWALAKILKYNKDGDFLLLRSFAKQFLSGKGFDVSLIKHPEIIPEKEGHIDVQIKEPNSYAIIIENKLKGADYQRNQLARYINQIQEEGYKDEQIFIVLLPKWCQTRSKYLDDLRPSIWRLPKDYKTANGERRCRYHNGVLCWCDDKYYTLKQNDIDCNECKKDYRQIFKPRTVVIHKEITEWLKNECMDMKFESEIIIKSFIIQFSDFLNLIYNNRDNKKLTKEMEEYLRKKMFDSNESKMNNWIKVNQKIKEIDNLRNEIDSLRSSLSGEIIDEWYEQLREEWAPYLLKQDSVQGKHFVILIQDVWCGCWCDSDKGGKPFWGFRVDNSTDPETKKPMVDEILKEAQMSVTEEPIYNPWLQWNYAEDGAEDCRKLYNAAVKLGYLQRGSNNQEVENHVKE